MGTCEDCNGTGWKPCESVPLFSLPFFNYSQLCDCKDGEKIRAKLDVGEDDIVIRDGGGK